jgi:hypothetical protein
MCAKSKALSLVSLPALLSLLVLTTGQGQAVPKKTADQCGTDHVYCLSNCGDKVAACKKNEESGCEARRIICKDNCDTAKKDCLKDAKTAPKGPKTKVLPKDLPELQPVEPKMEPKVQPEGGVQQQ